MYIFTLWHIHICRYTYTYCGIHTYVDTHIHIVVHTRIRRCTYTYCGIHIRRYTCTHCGINTHIYVDIHKHIVVHTHIHKCTYTHCGIHTHTHTHTHVTVSIRSSIVHPSVDTDRFHVWAVGSQAAVDMWTAEYPVYPSVVVRMFPVRNLSM